jgi:hypothetical protein
MKYVVSNEAAFERALHIVAQFSFLCFAMWFTVQIMTILLQVYAIRASLVMLSM